MTEMKADLIIRGNAIFDGVADEPFAGFVAVNGNRIASAYFRRSRYMPVRKPGYMMPATG